MSPLTSRHSVPGDPELNSAHADASIESSNDFRGALATVRRRAGLILICAALSGVVAVGFSMLQEKQYTATASLLFRDPGFAQGVFGTAAVSQVSGDPAREAATNLQLVGLQVVADRTAKAEGSDSTGSEVLDHIEIEASGNSDLVSVEATDASPARAQSLANIFAAQFIAFRANADRTKLLAAKQLADRQFERLSASDQRGARGEQLSRGAEKLGILASLQTGNAELVQKAERPTSPSAPKTVRNGAIGLVLGLLVGIGLAIIFERLDRRIREPSEAEAAFGASLLGHIPQSKSITASNRGVAVNLPFQDEEAFQMLGASLRYFNIDSALESILITSDSSGAGKSTVAWNLARASARSSKTVLLEIDLRSPSMSSNHGVLPGPGLSDLLTHQVQLDQAIQSIEVANGTSLNEQGSGSVLDVITAGAVPPNPSSLIESEAMTGLLNDLGDRYELVIIDTPPTGIVADAFPLMAKVDAVIAVARMNHTSLERARSLRGQLNRLNAPLIGVVANGIRTKRDQKYGYGYYGSPSPSATETAS